MQNAYSIFICSVINNTFSVKLYVETSSPLVLYKSSICKELCGNVIAAKELLRKTTLMLPANQSLKYHLMQMYIRNNDETEAEKIGAEISKK